jgi:hypothetical protein
VKRLFLLLSLCSVCAFAGGPLAVGGPTLGIDGQAFKWDVSQPIQYRVDTGAMSIHNGFTVIDNATGLARVQAMFDLWQSVPTTAIRYTFAGPIQAAGSFTGGDVKTLADFNAVEGSCNSGAQSPVIFDADGSMFKALGLPDGVIGFASPCKLDSATGHIASAFLAMNGVWQDADSDAANNPELTANEFDQAITHEIGHFSGLDHSQINVETLTQSDQCTPDKVAGTPLMFPILSCPSKKSFGLPVIAPDDAAWISYLYPNANFSSQYGVITGHVFFSDGRSQAQGVNVIARVVDDPATAADESRSITVSAVSGLYFTDDLGQSVTGDSPGDPLGTHSAAKLGYFEIPVPAGKYTLEVETIDSDFVAGSSVGPLNPPIPMPGPAEFWNDAENSGDDVNDQDTITINAGDTLADTDFILDNQLPTFDDFEDDGAQLAPPLVSANTMEVPA